MMKTKKKPVLLSGGNPQIAKGDGDALDEKQLASWFKQAAAVPGWVR